MRQLTFDDIFELLQQAADQVQVDEETEATQPKVTESSVITSQLDAIYKKAMDTDDYQAALKAINLKLEYGL